MSAKAWRWPAALGSKLDTEIVHATRRASGVQNLMKFHAHPATTLPFSERRRATAMTRQSPWPVCSSLILKTSSMLLVLSLILRMKSSSADLDQASFGLGPESQGWIDATRLALAWD